MEDPARDGTQSIRRQFMMMASQQHPAPTIAKAFIEGYRNIVGFFQDSATNIHEEYGEILDLGVYSLRVAELARRAKLRTVASFALFSSDVGDGQYSTLFIPRDTITTLLLEERELWIDMLGTPEGREWHDSLIKNGEGNRTLQGILQGNKRLGYFAVIGCAINMPTVGQIEQALQGQLS